MKIDKIKGGLLAMAMLVAGGFTSCSSDVDFGEQYQKTLCIIGANGMLHSEIHYFKKGVDLDTARISIYCAGSEPLSHDLTVTVGLDMHALDSLNEMGHLSSFDYVDKIMLPEANYRLLSNSVTIAAGTQYKTLEIELDMTGLLPEVDYVIPLRITENSANYAVNPAMQTMIYHVKMANGYSGNYNGTSKASSVSTVNPELRALSHNQVRMPIHTLDDDNTVLNTNFMVLTVADDSTTVTITPWLEAQVTDLGGSTFDKKRQSFTLNYSYTRNDKEVEVLEVIRNVENNYQEEDEVVND